MAGRAALLAALLALFFAPWGRILGPAFTAIYPIGVAIMEDIRIPEEILDLGLRPALRAGFHFLVADLEQKSADVQMQPDFVDGLRQMPIALSTAEANEQHYEVETQFFDIALGKRKKYSSGLWDLAGSVAEAGGPLLEASEERMLDLYVQRGEIGPGQTILDLGCGWGSVTLYLAERFPTSRIVGVSNSKTQRAYILGQAKEKGFTNVEVETLNVATPAFADFIAQRAGTFDRAISIEMFEHMKNYPALLRLVSTALRPEGRLFLHIFCHKTFAYHFESDGVNGWMNEHFFKDGTMPSQFLLQHFQADLTLEQQWNVNGRHYALTLEGWLQRMDAQRDRLLAVFGGGDAAKLALRRWRIFMLVCAEFFAFRGGSEFFVTHLKFQKPA